MAPDFETVEAVIEISKGSRNKQDALIKAGAIVGMDPDYQERQLEVAPEEDPG